MRIVIIGAVAAGTSAATEIRRQNKKAEIVVYERDSHISYAGCGMPYYIGKEFTSFRDLVPRDPEFFKSKHNVDILLEHEVQAIHPENNSITVKNKLTGSVFEDSYDSLVIATGASSVDTGIKGSDSKHVFHLRNINDVVGIKSFIDNNKPRTAAIIGSGLVGLEMCESFVKLGIETTLIARSSIAKSMDKDMAFQIESCLRANGVEVFTNSPTKEITDTEVILEGVHAVKADIVLLATGTRPNVELARAAGIEIGDTGAIKVSRSMKTSVDNIYSCGDCVEVLNLITERPVYRPLGSTANKTGVVAGNNIAGGNDEFRGILGTSIFRIFDMSAAQTGLSESEARKCGFEVVTCTDTKPNKPRYMGGKDMIIKSVAEKSSGKLLGAQIIGFDGVDKRIDVFATAISLKAKADDLISLDLSYAPPFSTPRDPLYYTGVKLRKSMHDAE